MNHEQIEAVAAVFRDAPTLTEIELRGGAGISLRLRRPAPRKKAHAAETAAAAAARVPSSNGASSTEAAGAVVPSGHPVETLVPVTASVVGIFRALDGSAGVEPGAFVKAGQVLGHIEAIRLLNECVAPSAGVLRGVHVHAGQPVEYGQLLFEIGSATAEEAS